MDQINPNTPARTPLLAFFYAPSHLHHVSSVSTHTWTFISGDDLLPVKFLCGCLGLEKLFLVCKDGATRELNANRDTGLSRLTCKQLKLDVNKSGYVTALFTGPLCDHAIYSCDGCGESPIKGTRYKCVPVDGCDNFDLCEVCYEGPARVVHEIGHRFVACPFFYKHLNLTYITNTWEYLQSALIAGGQLPVLGLPALTAEGPDAIPTHKPGVYEWVSFAELLESVLDFAAGLSSLPWNEKTTSLQTGARRHVGLCSDNSIEWVIADMACKFLGYVTFTVHVNFSDSQMSSALSLAACDIFLTSDDSITKRIIGASSATPLQHIIQIRGDPLPTPSVNVIAFASVRASGKGVCVPPRDLPREALSTVIFTSGTTGQPKGVMVTYGLELDMLSRAASRGFFSRTDVSIIFEPLAWMTARDDVYVTIARRGSAVLYEPARFSLEGLFAELPLLQPTHFKAVPLIYNKLYLEWRALAAKCGNDEVALKCMRDLHPLGKRLQVVITGGAKTAPKVLDFLRSCFTTASVVDAMGTTEAGAVLNDTYLVNGAEAKLVDVPHLGYFSSGNPPRGEFVVRTSTMSPGYFGDSKTTNEKFDGGWFSTGDIVEKLNSSQYVIIDRVAAFLKLASGEFVSPSHIEESLVNVPNVKQICVCASIGDAYLVAVVVMDGPKLPETDILNSFLKAARKCGLALSHLPRRVVQTEQPFSIEDGTLTPTGKLNRICVAHRYKAEIEALMAPLDELKDSDTLVDKVSKISAELLGVPLPSYRESLRAAGFHSELSVRLARRLETDCGLKGGLQFILAENATPESIAAGLQSSSIGVSEDELFKADIEGAEHLVKEASPTRRTSQLSTVLLTGATGFVGRYLLLELMKQPLTQLVCIVRANSDQHALHRVRQALQETGLPIPMKKIEVFAGNLEEFQFGLSAQCYAHLVSSVKLVVHCAAYVNWVLPYSALRSANVKATRSIIAFAAEGRPMEIHYISSISAAPSTKETAEFPRRYPFLGSDMGYARSKWVSELLLRSSSAPAGLAVYRLGMCGPATNGFCMKRDMIPRFLAGVAALSAAPNVAGHTELTSVDKLASLVVRAITSRCPAPATVCTFHVVNDREQYVGWRDMADAAAAAVGLPNFQRIPHSEWVERVTTCDSPLRPLTSFVRHSSFFRDPREFENKNFKAAVEIEHMPVVDLTSLQAATKRCAASWFFCENLCCWQKQPCLLHAE